MEAAFKSQLKVFYYGSVFFFFCIIVFVGTCIHRRDDEYSTAYFNRLHLDLQGIVTDKVLVSNDAGLVFIDVKSSNREMYDVRSTDSIYYCVIKGQQAELMESGISRTQIGDSAVVSSAQLSYSIYRKGKLIFSYPLHLHQSGSTFFFSRKQHRL